jgi:hypothetical protein
VNDRDTVEANEVVDEFDPDGLGSDDRYLTCKLTEAVEG